MRTHLLDVDEDIRDLMRIQAVVPSGSYYMCKPRITNTDKDYFTNLTEEAMRFLKGAGYRCAEGCNINSDFISYRKGDNNVVLVRDLTKCKLATELCMELNLKEKEERLLVFNTIRYGRVSKEKSTCLK